MIGPRQPLGGAAAHPLEADQHVLNDVVEGVADVQDVRDVRWRDDDDIWLGAPPFPRLERAGVEPALIDAGFYGPRIVCHSLI